MNQTGLSLRIDHPLVSPELENYRPNRWPPDPMFAVVVDEAGKVVSRYGDSIWDFSIWAGSPAKLNFGDGLTQRRPSPPICRANANLLRQIVFWWLYGRRGLIKASTCASNFYCMRQLFAFCTKKEISASDLYKFPLVLEDFISSVGPTTVLGVFQLISQQHLNRDALGFQILDHEGLRRFESMLPKSEVQQTVYIPPRIWTYQANRQREFLEDFLSNKLNVANCFKFCMETYANAYGSIAAAFNPNRPKNRVPFSMGCKRAANAPKYSFHEVASQFGLLDLLLKWCAPNISPDRISIRTLSKLLTGVSEVGVRYIANFTLMRIDEAWSLRADCHSVENDIKFGPIHILSGHTTKTIEDDKACWITSASSKIAVEAMAFAAKLRAAAAAENPQSRLTPEFINNPYLVSRALEPWASIERGAAADSKIRHSKTRYTRLFTSVPGLLEIQELRITQADLDIARLVTPTLDNEVFTVGAIWPLANHQLRRTGAVNMQASGLVSDASLQYQLKQVSRDCAIYYGRGYSKVALNKDAEREYLRTFYEIMGKTIAQLFTPRFVSPLGSDHKSNALKLIEPKDVLKLEAAAKAGEVSFRETLLGGCLHRGACQYGGIDNIARCGGGDGGKPCHDALYDRSKLPKILKLRDMLTEKIDELPFNSLLRTSLEAQQRSVANAISVLSKGISDE